MALANFFDKAALGASQILHDYDRSSFEETLNNNNIAIVFGWNATSTFEGRIALELIVRLSARLYPNLQFINTSGNAKFEQNLLEIAKSINPDINLNIVKKPTVYLVSGSVKFDTESSPVYYIGSSEWNAFFSSKKNIGFGKSKNIFGAAAAACFGTSNVFRKVFEAQLPFGEVDSDFSFSVFHFAKNYVGLDEPCLKNDINIEELLLVGVGAIGNSVLWAFKNIPLISGKLHLIDKEKIELSNLQRYLLSEQKNIDYLKVDVGESFLKNSSLQVTKSSTSWQEYMLERKNWNIKKVAVCLDSAEDRIAVQAALPKVIYNAWTQQESIGISRHQDFLNSSCLTCLYFPTHKKSSRSEEISNNLGIPQHERLVRKYLAEGKPVDTELLNLVSQAKNIEFEKLGKYKDVHIEVFHSKTVCGGGNNDTK